MIAVFKNIWRSFQRQQHLFLFWQQRTTFYRDCANALEEKELLQDFIAGELLIATQTLTANKAKARGLAYIQEVMQAGDFNLQQVLTRSMPTSDAIALSTLSFTRHIPTALRELADNLDQQHLMNQMLKSALVSPLILLPVAYVFAYVLSSISIPEFSKAAPPEVWTPFNQLVKSTAETFESYGGAFALIVLFTSVWLFFWALPQLTHRWRFQLENSQGYHKLLWCCLIPFQPVFSLYRDIQATRMLGNLANLMQSGMLLQDAVDHLLQHAQAWMQKHLAMVNEHLQIAPGDYVGAFSHGVLSPYLLARMSSMVRRDSGAQFDKILIVLGTTGMAEAMASVKQTAVKLNAILLTLTFALIVFFYGGQNSIAFAIQEANSPATIMQRQLQKQQSPHLQAPHNSSQFLPPSPPLSPPLSPRQSHHPFSDPRFTGTYRLTAIDFV
jgi:hypothetical protein